MSTNPTNPSRTGQMQPYERKLLGAWTRVAVQMLSDDIAQLERLSCRNQLAPEQAQRLDEAMGKLHDARSSLQASLDELQL